MAEPEPDPVTAGGRVLRRTAAEREARAAMDADARREGRDFWRAEVPDEWRDLIDAIDEDA